MPGKEYRFQVAEQRNFVIVFPSMVSAFLKDAREAGIAGGKLKLEQILELSLIHIYRHILKRKQNRICEYLDIL